MVRLELLRYEDCPVFREKRSLQDYKRFQKNIANSLLNCEYFAYQRDESYEIARYNNLSKFINAKEIAQNCDGTYTVICFNDYEQQYIEIAFRRQNDVPSIKYLINV